MLDQYEAMSNHFLSSSLLAKFPLLNKFWREFKALPGNARYMASMLMELPFNNKMAGFGQTPSIGEKIVPGKTYAFDSYSGMY